MSELTDRRAAWDAKEAVRQIFILPNSVDAVNYKELMLHKRERDVLLLAEAIRDNGGWSGATVAEPPDGAMLAEAAALAAG